MGRSAICERQNHIDGGDRLIEEIPASKYDVDHDDDKSEGEVLRRGRNECALRVGTLEPEKKASKTVVSRDQIGQTEVKVQRWKLIHRLAGGRISTKV